ncbi:DUF1549 domain-containing protein [Singulisphaera acidiphila]|uniref:DUF1549 domain-containing protein n=1 Tax=Singulisphaera acidiphila (strain ATCC BAA-1392 / DSM 18658 / VKM B-2454 / MOB10) TaxID=886293 RepID=L0D4Z4_SINAD|nr:DUF1549 domain-containing protein [Singulisphaera acidiphila]AGA24504.1 Protein of unknown function (DUF1553)/Protein of unknown function (DUF1549) [Singulisphaera acidiphila DSM 18658]
MNRLPFRLRLGLCAYPMLCVVGLLTSTAGAADAPAPPLHERIDRVIDASHVGPPVALAGDAEFLRRVSLDLTGMPPSSEELRNFLADTAADKRTKAVDRLLESPLYSRHLATTFDIMLMERRPNKDVTAEEWQNYLLQAARENRPLNHVLKEVLSADGADAKLRAAARFYLDRGAEPNLITRDVGRIFFGRDMQCAQCHNHPVIDDYQQSDYHGLVAFFTPAYALVRKEGGKDQTVFAEKTGGDLTFDSVFVKNDKHLTGPRILGETELVEPVFPPGEEYQVKPADNVLPVPKFSRRAQLASHVTGGTNRAFNENIANRLWAMLMGRGLVHPLDLHHPANPPSHPELMALLADELVARNYDTKAFLRELALTRTYQRAIDLPADQAPQPEEVASTVAELKTRTEALTAASEAARKEYSQAIKDWYAAETTLVPAAAEQDQALAKHAEVDKKQAEAQKAVNDLLAQINAREDVGKSLAEAAGKAQEAAKKLPEEKDLAAAAQKFVDRSNALIAEVAALKKTSPDKAAALTKAGEELAAAVKPVEAARAKALPLRDVVRQKEQVVLAARRKTAESKVALERHKRQLERRETFAQRETLRGQAVAIAQAAVASREAVAQAQKLAKDFEPDLLQHQTEVKTADQTRLALEKSKADAEAALTLQQKRVASVDAALAATDAAREQLPDDPTLTEAAQKLKTKADELRSVAATQTTQRDAALAELKKGADALALANRGLDASMAEKARRDNLVAAAQKKQADEEARAQALESEIAAATEQLATLQSNSFDVAQLKPLTPEQMCWSILKVTGIYDRFHQAEEAELNKTKPLDEAARNDPAQVRARALELEQRTFDKLKGNVASFVTVYGAGAGQPQNDFFATADQALFAANGGLVNGWVAPAGGNVSERMAAEQAVEKAAEDLYVTILTRLPSPEESADVVRVLTEQAANKPAAVQELVWGLLTSAEFRFNH